MEHGLRTPLLDSFTRGDVDRDVRLLAAQGALAPKAHEQLALLMHLVDDPDPEVARAAEATLAAISRPSLESFLARSDVPAEMRAFFQTRGIEGHGLPGADDPLFETPLEMPPLPEASAGSDAAADAPPSSSEEGAAADESEDRKTSVTQRLASMTVAQRMSAAMKGSREERAILIRDPNKLVSSAVLSSPKITESEIESIARMANVSEDILRLLAGNRAWVKNYNVALALARNPKTPLAISMNLLGRLAERDLRQLSTNRNVPEILRVTARKKVVIDK